MESIKLTEGMAERCVTVLRVIRATGINAWWRRRKRSKRRRRRKVTAAASACGAHTRAMIDALKLRARPLSEIKLANRAGDRPVRTLLAVAATGCVIRRTPTRCPIFFTRPPFSSSLLPVFGRGRGRVREFLDTGQLEKESETPENARAARGGDARVDFRNYETPLAPGGSVSRRGNPWSCPATTMPF